MRAEGAERRPTLVIVGGPNGSGKTTITEQLVRHESWLDGCEYINPDNIAEELFGGWNNPKSSLKAAQYCEDLRERLLSERKSLAFETVMSAHDKFDFVYRAKEAGYFVRLFFVCTDDPSINGARVTRRVMQGGHTVPIDKIINRYYKSIGNAVALAPIVDRAYFYDNSVENADAQLLFRVADGAVAKRYEHDRDVKWAHEILEWIEPARGRLPPT